jgi:hypothetical protein
VDWELKGSDQFVFTLAGDSTMRDGKTFSGLHIGVVMLLSASFATPALAAPPGPVESPADMAVIELLRAEVLDTVLLDRPVHFTTPETTDTVAQAGTYRVETGEPSQMKLVALKHSTAMVIDALNIRHDTDIAEPIALYVRDDEKFPHVVLLLPGGQGLEAVGSYDGSRARGLRILPLTPIQLQKALQKKMEKKKENE